MMEVNLTSSTSEYLLSDYFIATKVDWLYVIEFELSVTFRHCCDICMSIEDCDARKERFIPNPVEYWTVSQGSQASLWTFSMKFRFSEAIISEVILRVTRWLKSVFLLLERSSVRADSSCISYIINIQKNHTDKSRNWEIRKTQVRGCIWLFHRVTNDA
jgi:hypothetical protein